MGRKMTIQEPLRSTCAWIQETLRSAQTEKGAHQGPSPLSAAAENLINDDIRGYTKKIYKLRVNTFADYCTKRGANTKSCHPNIVMYYWMTLALDRGLSYHTVCWHRSAIAKQHIGVGGTPLGMLPEIKRLVGAIFIDRPPLPRYTKGWDVNQVLQHIETRPSLADLSDMELSIKTATLTFIFTLSRFDDMIDG